MWMVQTAVSSCLCNRWYLYVVVVAVVFSQSNDCSVVGAEAALVVPRDERGKTVLQVSTRLANGQHLDRVSFTLEVFDRNYTLELEQNRGLVSSSFKEVHFSSTGFPVSNQGFENCFYHGTILDIDDSHVVVSTCNGLSGLFYYGKDLETFYFIEPAGLLDGDKFLDGHLHSVYTAADMEVESISFCDAVNGNKTEPQNLFHHVDLINNTLPRRLRRDVVSDEKIVELVIVNDHSQFIARNSDINQVTLRSISLANIMDLLYKPLNTRIALVGVETWNDTDRVTVDSSLFVTLERFADYRRSELLTRFQSHDNAQLLSNVNFTDLVGLAFYRGICSDGSSAGVVQDTFSEAATATIITHELGHNLGLLHDDGRTCDDCLTGCLMRRSFNSSMPYTSFSNCSREDYEVTLRDGFGVCLFDTPAMLVGGPICGNGFIEDGEGCDCGSAMECLQKNDTCCNSTNCQLFDGASCSSVEPCCTSECKFASSGSLCRSLINSCDLEEFCTGSSADCPDNLYLQDLSPCSESPAGVCYNGQCETHDLQCKEIFGENARKADDFCYDLINIRGTADGNCGTSESSFVPCGALDVECGVLICEGGENVTIVSLSGAVVITQITTNAINPIICKRVEITFEDVANDIRYVRDGTKCGIEKICQARKCINPNTLAVPSCPTDQAGNVCSGNGVCNNLNSCSCSEGLEEPDCKEGKSMVWGLEGFPSISELNTSSDKLIVNVVSNE
ncbi:zinc metalloproteinase-disintegrin-like lachestatin-1 [Corticium candelabrum]|uniref:zinc metalloproteinase-disintegrin-like lachestatin-1 n=1 Tax=Corticium candelabrum TaxID=121492 RepID=UPI002E25E4A5|nr:zinc metalloproteinase-disintegrin-like lachestatin-1 [Corticium candelabrum]XP_062522510.1 zinc metalloproteinase-disintegrin-like lachestatin-1 [Corticium candelabrum]XP_062522511.1 zinc metalloproteinase-disintegrin-like lachestatin-1 [Corticium candelabrum]